MTEARRSLLAPVLELQDGVKRYLEVLGEDRGKSARMSRSSHRELLAAPGRAIDAAWKTARLKLRGTAVARVLETTFESRTAPLIALTDAVEHANTWDETVRALGDAVDELIRLIDEEESDDELAQRLGYRALIPHRAGGYGVVYRAEDMLGVVSALKILHPYPTIPAETAHPRFQREADALTKLRHPNIVQYRRLGRVGNRQFLEMEFVSGVTLLDWIKPGSFEVTYTDRVRAIIELLRALQHAHEHGIFHRDLKPDNVLVRENGTVVLVDFGLAWIAGCVDSSFTSRSTWSLDYAPPEVREDPQQSRGPNHDIFSVGVVLNQLLTGRRIVEGCLSDVDPSLASIDPVLQRALAPLPARFPTAREFADALDRALEGLKQPWLMRAANAGRIRSVLLRGALLGTAEAATDDANLPTVCVALAGTFEALRIHLQRFYRTARGSDAPRNEAFLPAILSPSAHLVFPEHPSLSTEPKLAEDKYGEAALANAGFSMGDLALFQRLIELTHALRTPARNAIPKPSGDELLIAHQRLVERILRLESSDRLAMQAFDTYERVVNTTGEDKVELTPPRTADELLVLLAAQGTDDGRGHVRFKRQELADVAPLAALDLADMITLLESRGLIQVNFSQGHVLPIMTQLTHAGREAAHRLGVPVPSPENDADELRRGMVAAGVVRRESSASALAKIMGWPEVRILDAARVLHDQGRAEARQLLGRDGFRVALTAKGRLEA